MARILIADDDEDVLESMAMQLEVFGHETVMVQDPDDLLTVAEQQRPDMILQDLKMGGISLAGLVANIKSHPATADVPLVFFSANAQLPALARKYGAWDYLPKPFTQQQLADLLDRFLGEGDPDAEASAATSLGRKEVMDLFHDHANTLAAMQNYLSVLLNQPDLPPKAQRSAEAIQGLMTKLEGQVERLRSGLGGT